jgi:hypothetical protein
MDLHIPHDRVWSSKDPTLNGHLRHPNNLDKSLNDADADKIRKYRADYNNRTPNAVSFMPAIASTSGRLHSEFVRLLFLQTHRETDRFFPASAVQLAQSTSGQFHFRRTVFGTPRRNDKQPGKEEKIIFWSGTIVLAVSTSCKGAGGRHGRRHDILTYHSIPNVILTYPFFGTQYSLF